MKIYGIVPFLFGLLIQINTLVAAGDEAAVRQLPPHIAELNIQENILTGLLELDRKITNLANRQQATGDSHDEQHISEQLSIILNHVTALRVDQKTQEIRAQEQEQRLLLMLFKLNSINPAKFTDPVAQMAEDDYDLGKMAYHGLYGMNKSFSNAIEHFENILTQRVNLKALAGANCYLGQIYFFGLGKVQNLVKALEYFQEAAGLKLNPSAPVAERKAANPEARAIAHYFLGRLHYDWRNNGQLYNPDKAAEYFERAAKQELDSQALQGANFFLGKIYKKARHIRAAQATIVQNLLKAAAALAIAQENREFQVRAWSYLAKMALDREEWDSAVENLKKVVLAPNIIEKNEMKALARAQYHLGEIAIHNDFKTLTRETAEEYLKKAASKDDDEVIKALARRDIKFFEHLALDNRPAQ